MGEQTHEMREKLKGPTRKLAMEAIEELPEQVEEVLQQSATTVFEEAQGKVAVMQEMVREQKDWQGQFNVAQAMESLEVIPSIVLDSFEHNVAKVKDAIRHRVRVGDFTSNDEFVAKMRSLPIEVQQIAGDALEAAQEESKAQTRVQFEDALQKLPAGIPALGWQMVERVPRVPWDAQMAAREAASEPVEQAVAAVT